MKTQIRSLLTLFSTTTASLLIIGSSAQAGYTVTLEQVGPNVVATGSGALDLTGLIFFSPGGGRAEMQPITASLFTGPASDQPLDMYGQASGPTSFGIGGGIFANSGSGDLVGIEGNVGFIFVPQGYVFGSPLSDSATYNSATFSSLGVTPGVYEWTWGTGVEPELHNRRRWGCSPRHRLHFCPTLSGFSSLSGRKLAAFYSVSLTRTSSATADESEL